MLIRFFIPILALFGTSLLYWMLYQAIVVSSTKKLEHNSIGNINFTRILQEENIDKKQRVKKEIPKPKPIKSPPKIATNIPKETLKMNHKNLQMDIPLVKLPVNINQNSFLKGAVLSQNISRDTQATPMLRVPPIYPRRAMMLKKEGFVKLKLFINSKGFVKDAKILESKPKKIFDKAALKSVYGWKFKPRVIGGKAVDQIATQTLEFKLRN